MHLTKLASAPLRKGPVLLVIMDGVAIGKEDEGNAVHLARTPTLARLRQGMWTTLQAHGTAVGMPSNDDMGNSEVGHNALGAGRIFAQGARLVNDALSSGRLFAGPIWQEMIERCKVRQSALHLIGLLSDGNVHSHEEHLHALIKKAHAEGLSKVFVHALLDGRDVAGRSALTYVERLEAVLSEINANPHRRYKIASGGGRMVITMDRYEADWEMVSRGWQTHVCAKGPPYATAREAILAGYADERINDQFLPPFVIVEDGRPVGPICDGDGVILFNFRGDRAIEICRAFVDESFTKFERGPRPDVLFAGMMQYDGDLKIPSRYLVAPPAIDGTISEYLIHQNVRQYAISETQKFGHVTYFWNGNRSGKFDAHLEHDHEVPSDRVPFEERPWMKAAEITDQVIKAMLSGQYDFLRLNYANGDMVGHTGHLEATILAVQTVDLCISRLLPIVDQLGGVALITADHGNADEMFEYDKDGHIKHDAEGRPKVKTSHTLNRVPCYFYDPCFRGEYRLANNQQSGLSNVAATLLGFLGFAAPADYDPSLIALI